MRTHARRAVWIALSALLALGLTGCFRSAGEDLEPTPKSGLAPAVEQSPSPVVTEEPAASPESTTEDLAPTAEQMTPLASPEGTASLVPFPTIAAATQTALPTSADGQGGPLVAPPTRTPTSVIRVTNTPFPTQGPQATYTPLPTYTPFPTNTVLPSSTPLPTYTPPPTYTRVPSSTPVPTQRLFGPTQTFTPVPFATFPPSPTYTPYYMSGQGGPLSVASAPVTSNQGQAASGEAVPLAERPPEQVQATPFGAEQLPGAAIPTATPVPTNGPIGGGTPPLDGAQGEVAMQATPLPGQLTATMIVFEATATSAALTGTPLATWTPGPVDTTGQGGPAVATQPAVVQPGQFPPNATVITATPYGQGGVCAQHLIGLGETLFSIARRYDVTAEQIQQINPALIPTIDQITAGTTIDIPCPVPVTPTPQPVPVVTGVPVDGQGGQLVTTPTGQVIHVVVPGDTLFSISRQYGVDIYDLMRVNGFTTQTMNYIYEGQEIIVPGQAVAATPVVTQQQPAGVAPTLTPYIIIVTPAQ